MAIGIVFCGSFDSPAATPTISVPWNENPAIIATPISADKPPTKGASPLRPVGKSCDTRRHHDFTNHENTNDDKHNDGKDFDQGEEEIHFHQSL